MSVLDEGFRGGSGGSRNRPHGNLTFLRVSVFALFGILGVRLFAMQIVDGEDYARRSRENHIFEQNILPTRGLIVDRNGESLVQNVGVYKATLVPELLPEKPEDRRAIYQKLEEILKVPAAEIQAQVKDNEDKGQAYLEMTVKDRLTNEEALMLDEATTDMPGVKLNVTPGRQYVDDDALAHVLGYIGPQFKENRDVYRAQGYAVNEPVGVAGLEKQYEKDLRGTAGYSASEQDAQGHLISALQTKDPVPGNTLQLSIDKGLQDYVYDLLTSSMDDGTWHARTAAAVVMNPKTGQVYSIVSVPGFNPNLFTDPSLKSTYDQLNNDDVHTPMLNHALSPAAPGSTFKLVTATAALSEGNIVPSTGWNVTSTVLEIKGENGQIYPLYDWRAHGYVNLYSAIAWSSNIYFYMASCGLYGYGPKGLGNGDSALGAVILGQYARRLGFGGPSGIDLDGEFDGVIPDPAWKAKVHSGPGFNPEDREWYYSDTCFMGIGQGDVLATPIQVARMTAAVANGGKLVTPHVVSSVLSPDGKTVRTIQPEIKDTGLNPSYLADIREGMHESVTQGAGARAFQPGIDIAGKTGTAEFKEKGVTLQHAWFTGFAPFDDPEVVVTVYFDLGVGGDKAAPAAGKILDYFMKNVKQ